MIYGRKPLIQHTDWRRVWDEYIKPGVRNEVAERVREALAPVKKQIGYTRCSPVPEFCNLHAPDASVAEKIDALAEYLGVTFTTTAPTPSKVVAVKKETP